MKKPKKPTVSQVFPMRGMTDKQRSRMLKLEKCLLLIRRGITAKRIPDQSLIQTKSDKVDVIALSEYIDQVLA